MRLLLIGFASRFTARVIGRCMKGLISRYLLPRDIAATVPRCPQTGAYGVVDIRRCWPRLLSVYMVASATSATPHRPKQSAIDDMAMLDLGEVFSSAFHQSMIISLLRRPSSADRCRRGPSGHKRHRPAILLRMLETRA